MGEGDIIIGAVMGALLGVELSFVAIFISSILALPFSLYERVKGQLALPFIPFLAVATFIVFLNKHYFIKILHVIS
jgi:leader peptidase (prepilin peptidase)/N-methyltransferase